ncbi:MAG TPA: hypothetical protein P5161_00670 [Eubacteriales bacterium]|jgi:hypothetical protein|nr:hypothetical protein [Clostridia bacterium]HRR89282.1 hypothetical protein [Eubacteriales bacterium]HRU84238.1 hypothetical protein [Eubacteriales bacterium]
MKNKQKAERLAAAAAVLYNVNFKSGDTVLVVEKYFSLLAEKFFKYIGCYVAEACGKPRQINAAKKLVLDRTKFLSGGIDDVKCGLFDYAVVFDKLESLSEKDRLGISAMIRPLGRLVIIDREGAEDLKKAKASFLGIDFDVEHGGGLLVLSGTKPLFEKPQ